MKRSEINQYINHAKQMLEKNNITLPAFGYWEIDQWKAKQGSLDNLIKSMLGWDVTDFGSGDFLNTGSVLFTVRNGCLDDKNIGTPYAEKYIFQRHETEQQIPFHFHRTKTEDIINRGGGVLMLELYNSTSDDKIDTVSQVKVKMDGIYHTFAPGEVVEVEKGCSITLVPGLYHRFWAKKDAGDLIVGEVSSINDDNADNIFLDPKERFVLVDEDEAIIHPLCNEYHILQV